jgi:hypothetical protein
MTGQTQDEAIAAHLVAHDAKVQARTKARISASNRKKQRGLQAAIARMTSPSK